ncbi:MAG: patatin-like phospholipase family protein [Acidobacteriota bacterium]
MSDAPIWGLALGSGSARGWAHVGVLRALESLGIRPQVVTGSSVGAMVGAAWAYRRLRLLERWALSLRRRDVVGFLDLSLSGSLMKGERVYRLFERYSDVQIESLPRRFAAVATDFESGEVHPFTSGSVIDAVRASMSMPGLLPPVRVGDRWLMDGALADPIPVRLCRELGATRVIAVNLNRGIVRAKASRQLAEVENVGPSEEPAGDDPDLKVDAPSSFAGAFSAAVGDRLEELRRRLSPEADGESPTAGPGPKPPGLFDVMVGAVHILQDQVARARLAEHPPDLELCPNLDQIAMLEIYRAEEAIAEGRRVTLEAADRLAELG